MGNCITNNRVVSREADGEDPRAPFKKETTGADMALKQGGRGEGEGGQGGSLVMKKKKKMEKRVSFKLEEDDDKERAVGEEKRGDLRNGKRVTRRVKVVVTKEELRRILEYAERSSRPDSSSGLEELIMSLSSMRSGRGRVHSNGPGLECIPEHRP